MDRSMLVVFIGFLALTLTAGGPFLQESNVTKTVAPDPLPNMYYNPYKIVIDEDPLFGKGHYDEECHATPEDPDADCIPGVGGVDYPILSEVPYPTAFNCTAQQFPGLYSDPEYQCQVFHICNLERLKYSFLCPNGTILDQRYFVCVWWFSGFVCADAPKYYYLNEGFYNTSIPRAA